MKIVNKHLVLALLFITLFCLQLLTAQVTSEDSIYFLFTDRFYDGDTENNYSVNLRNLVGYHGGDFAGLEEKLPYIADMGFTAIWISSVVDNQSGGYHGYWAQDYYAVEEHFGDMDSLRSMVNRAHELDIKVIYDLAINHTGLQSDLYADDERRETWFNPRRDIRDYSDRNQVENYWLMNLPDFDQSNPEVTRYLIDMSQWWIDQTGADGYRLDALYHVPVDFWRQYSEELHQSYPDFYLIGEVANGDPAILQRYELAGIDGLLDFPMYYAFRNLIREGGPGQDFARTLLESKRYYENENLMGTFIDNHDVPRFINQVRRHTDEKLAQGLMFLFTYTGIPIMYYGTEIPADGGAEHTGRAMMDWDAEARYLNMVTHMNMLRDEHPALTNGEFRLITAEEHHVVYSRQSGDELFITILNNSSEEDRFSLELPEELRNGYRRAYNALLDAEGLPVGPGVPDFERTRVWFGRNFSVVLPAYSGVVLRLE